MLVQGDCLPFAIKIIVRDVLGDPGCERYPLLEKQIASNSVSRS